MGRRAVETLKSRLAGAVSDALVRDPERAARAVSLGLVTQDWIDDPARRSATDLAPRQVIERLVARQVAEFPSMLERLGFSVLDVLGEPEEPAVDEPFVTADLTILFTDLEGFTGHTQRIGDAEASRLLAEHYTTVDEIAGARGGRVTKRLGDGLMITFPTERAAVLAGVELLRHAPRPLRLRAGAHAGPVVTTGDDVFGHVVNVASRVAAIADGDSFVVTRDVRDGAGDPKRVRWSEPETVVVKGIDGPLEVFRAERRRGRRDRG